MSDSEQNNLFNVLEAHGQAFLKSFGPLYTTNSSKKRKMHVNTTKKRRRRYKECGDEENDEWYGVCVDSGPSDYVGVEGEREAGVHDGVLAQIETDYIFESRQQIVYGW